MNTATTTAATSAAFNAWQLATKEARDARALDKARATKEAADIRALEGAMAHFDQAKIGINVFLQSSRPITPTDDVNSTVNDAIKAYCAVIASDESIEAKLLKNNAIVESIDDGLKHQFVVALSGLVTKMQDAVTNEINSKRPREESPAPEDGLFAVPAPKKGLFAVPAPRNAGGLFAVPAPRNAGGPFAVPAPRKAGASFASPQKMTSLRLDAAGASAPLAPVPVRAVLAPRAGVAPVVAVAALAEDNVDEYLAPLESADAESSGSEN